MIIRKQPTTRNKMTYVIVPGAKLYPGSRAFPCKSVALLRSNTAMLIVAAINKDATANSFPGHARLPNPKTTLVTSGSG